MKYNNKVSKVKMLKCTIKFPSTNEDGKNPFPFGMNLTSPGVLAVSDCQHYFISHFRASQVKRTLFNRYYPSVISFTLQSVD